MGYLDTINRENDPNQAKLGKTCSHIMLEQCADHMSMLSEHFYCGRVPWQKDERTNLLAHVALLKDAIRHKADGHRKLQGSLTNLQGRLVPIAMDEWNYWHRDYVYGELGCIYELQDGLGVAAGLHEYFRQSDLIQMAHYAQTVNVIGAIKTTKTAAEMETTGLVLQVYRAHYGQIPLRLEQDFAPCDVAAALTKDGKALTIGVINPTESEIELTPIDRGRKAGGFRDPLAHHRPEPDRAQHSRQSPDGGHSAHRWPHGHFAAAGSRLERDGLRAALELDVQNPQFAGGTVKARRMSADPTRAFMKTAILSLTLAASLPALAQTNQPAVEDFKPSSLNQPGKQYPQVNSERRVRARVVAPQAQSVTLDFWAAQSIP